MIQLDRIKLSFLGRTLFEDVSFTLQRGEKCGFVGRNGSGKSTLFKLILGELEADSGELAIPKNYQIGYLQQHIHFSQPTVLEEAALGLRHDEKDQLYKAETILFGLGFTKEDMSASPGKFSGGYHLRLHLAKVLISNPDCLLLDEPTNYLDILSIRWLENFLRSWKGECIVISHERDFLDSISTHTMGIHRGKVKKIKGSVVSYFEQILFEEEIHERTRQKNEKKQAHMRAFVERFGAKATKAAQAQSRLKRLEKEPVLEKLNALENLSFHFPKAPFPGKKMVEMEKVHFAYQEPLISDLNFQIEKGERIAIIGKNGRGKSTLLRLLAQEIEPQKGALKTSENVKMGVFGQTNINRLHKEHTVEEEIALANHELNFTAVRGIAGKMMFSGDEAQKKIGVLSGGEKSRVLLAQILAKPCNLLLLDEPTHHLDIESVEALIDAIEDFEGSVVLVTHSELILRRMVPDKLIVCEKSGQYLFLGDYDLFLEKRGWEEESGVDKQKKEVLEKKKESAPSKWKIKACEEKIAVLESKQKDALHALEKGERSPEFFKSLAMLEEEIAAAYSELERLYL